MNPRNRQDSHISSWFRLLGTGVAILSTVVAMTWATPSSSEGAIVPTGFMKSVRTQATSLWRVVARDPYGALEIAEPYVCTALAKSVETGQPVFFPRLTELFSSYASAQMNYAAQVSGAHRDAVENFLVPGRDGWPNYAVTTICFPRP